MVSNFGLEKSWSKGFRQPWNSLANLKARQQSTCHLKTPVLMNRGVELAFRNC